MAYCKKCGKKLARDSRFCPNCGTPVEDDLSVTVETELDADESSTRRQVFVGLVRKCPSCGEELSPGAAICPRCGFELNTTKGSRALEEFTDQVNEIDEVIAAEGTGKTARGWSSWGGWKRFGWVVLNVYTLCLPILIPALLRLLRILFVVPKPKLTANESRKAEIIENYVVPNEKEAMTESLRFIRTKVEALKNQSNDERLMYWMNLWKVKAGQIYSKASKSLNNEEEIDKQYHAIERIVKGTNNKMRFASLIKAAVVIAAICMVVNFFKGPSWGEASMGVTLANITEEDAVEYNLESEGVYVAKVNTKAAEKAGFQVRDRIVTVDGRKIESADDVFSIIHFKSPGDIIPVTISREGKQYTLEVKLKRQR